MLSAFIALAVSESASFAAHRMVGVRPADGGAQLVKRFSVMPGSTILGVEFESNDPSTVFPEVSLLHGGSTALNEGVVVARATDVGGSVSGRMRVLWAQPIVVTQAGEYHVAIRMPAGAEKRGPGDGPGIGAEEVTGPSGSFVAGGPDGALLAIGGDLAVNLVTAGVGKAAGGGEEPERAVAPRTFFRVAASNPATGCYDSSWASNAEPT
jgi:hypothetical protein